MTDRQLLNLHLAGHPDALAQLARRHIDMVHAAARHFAGNDAAAQDITQAVFLLLIRRARALPRDTILPGWLYKTTWHVAREMRRQNQRQIRRERENLPMPPTTSAKDPPAAAITAEHRDALHDAIARLPADDRSTIVLHYLEGKTSAEVAAALATTDAAVRTRLTRAREKLRTLLRHAGITLSVAALLGLLESSQAQAAPVALLSQIQTLAAGTAPAASVQSLVTGVLHMAIRAKQITVAAALLIAALGVGTVVVFTRNNTPAPSVASTTPAATAASTAAALAPGKIIAIEFAGTADPAPLRNALTLHVGDDFSQPAVDAQTREMARAAATLKSLRAELTPGENRLGKGYILRFVAEEPDAVVAARQASKNVVVAAYKDALAGNQDAFVARFGTLGPDGKPAPISDENKTLLVALTRTMHAFDLLLTAVGEKFGPEVRAQLDKQIPIHVNPDDIFNSNVQLVGDARATVDMGESGPGKVPVVRIGDQWLVDSSILASMNADVVRQAEQKIVQINALTQAVKDNNFPSAEAFQAAIAGLMK
jgi:RNA polymerase sigma-70 factor (ECF subfamily)